MSDESVLNAVSVHFRKQVLGRWRCEFASYGDADLAKCIAEEEVFHVCFRVGFGVCPWNDD